MEGLRIGRWVPAAAWCRLEWYTLLGQSACQHPVRTCCNHSHHQHQRCRPHHCLGTHLRAADMESRSPSVVGDLAVPLASLSTRRCSGCVRRGATAKWANWVRLLATSAPGTPAQAHRALATKTGAANGELGAVRTALSSGRAGGYLAVINCGWAQTGRQIERRCGQSETTAFGSCQQLQAVPSDATAAAVATGQTLRGKGIADHESGPWCLLHSPQRCDPN